LKYNQGIAGIIRLITIRLQIEQTFRKTAHSLANTPNIFAVCGKSLPIRQSQNQARAPACNGTVTQKKSAPDFVRRALILSDSEFEFSRR
jgi:hypothetical protein